ncbi:hypothetical protein EV122DRAFT_273970 [Schizophyllum commune]
MVAEDEDGRLDQVPPLISIESRFASESVLLPSTIINAANADALCVFPSRAKYCNLPALKDLDAHWFSQSLPARTSLLIYDNNVPGYPIHQILDRYSSSLALMRNVFRSSHRSCMPTKSSPPLTLIHQDDRRGQVQAATLLSPPADDINVEAAGYIVHEPRTKATVFFVTRTLTLTTVLSVGDVDAANRDIDCRRAGKTSRGIRARPGVIATLCGKTRCQLEHPSDPARSATCTNLGGVQDSDG